MTRPEWTMTYREATCPRTWLDAVCTVVIVGCTLALIMAFGKV